MRAEGQTDYVAFVHRFGATSIIGEMDCVYSSWATSSPDGFREADLVALRRLVPLLALAIKCVSLARIARTLVEVYLGHDAGERVLSGRISRGVAERINAVIWYSDLRGYTKITDTAPPDEIIPLLNDYAAAVIAAVRSGGGEVLKLIGDGVLAIFRADDRRASVPLRAARRGEPAVRHQGGERAPRRGQPSRHVRLPWAAHRRSVLRQHRQRGSSGLHGSRPGGQRSESHCRDVPVGGPKRRPVVRIRRGDAGAGTLEARFRGPLRVARCRPCRGVVHARSRAAGRLGEPALRPSRQAAHRELSQEPSSPATRLIISARITEL